MYQAGPGTLNPNAHHWIGNYVIIQRDDHFVNANFTFNENDQIMLEPSCLRLLRHFLKRAGGLAKLEWIHISDGRWRMRVEAFVIDTRRIGTVEISQCIGTANMFQRGMNTGNSIRSLHLTQIYLGRNTTQVMIIASHHGTLTGQLYLLTIAKGQRTPGHIWIIQWHGNRSRYHRFGLPLLSLGLSSRRGRSWPCLRCIQRLWLNAWLLRLIRRDIVLRLWA